MDNVEIKELASKIATRVGGLDVINQQLLELEGCPEWVTFHPMTIEIVLENGSRTGFSMPLRQVPELLYENLASIVVYSQTILKVVALLVSKCPEGVFPTHVSVYANGKEHRHEAFRVVTPRGGWPSHAEMLASAASLVGDIEKKSVVCA